MKAAASGTRATSTRSTAAREISPRQVTARLEAQAQRQALFPPAPRSSPLDDLKRELRRGAFTFAELRELWRLLRTVERQCEDELCAQSTGRREQLRSDARTVVSALRDAALCQDKARLTRIACLIAHRLDLLGEAATQRIRYELEQKVCQDAGHRSVIDLRQAPSSAVSPAVPSGVSPTRRR